MAIIRNNYTATNIAISPFYLKAEKEGSYIIIDDVTGTGRAAQMRTELSNPVIWLKVGHDYQVTPLQRPPGDLTQLEQFNNLNLSRLIVTSDEAYVIEYAAAPLTDATRSRVTGFKFGQYDTVYVKMDQTANTITLYHSLPVM